MTGNLFVDLLVSAGGILLLVGLSWSLGGWNNRVITLASARNRLKTDEPDFTAEDWLVSVDGRAALALGTLEIVLIFSIGDKMASRRAARSSLYWDRETELINIKLDDPTVPLVGLRAGSTDIAAEWARLLN